MAPILLVCGVWNGGGVCCCRPALSSVCGLACTPPRCVSEYCCRVTHCYLSGVWCVGECVSVVFVWWGILCLLPLRRGGGWGHHRRAGAIADGGWHGEGRAAVLLASPSACWRPPCRLLGGLIEWRVWCGVVSPCLVLPSPLHIVLAPLALSYSLSYRLVSPLLLCLLSQHC